MSDKLEIVKIKCGDDHAIINKKDFDPKKHELFEEKKKEPKKKKKVVRKKKEDKE